MSASFAEIVNLTDIWQTVVYATVATVGVTLAFSIAIYGATRFADLNRDEKPLAAGMAAAIGVLAFAAVIAACVFGIIVMSNK